MKQILRLRWRWFSHSSQGSAGSGGGSIGGVGGYIQQDGLDHRGTPVQGRLKSHSRERGIGGLRKTSSPAHSILAPTPGPTPVCVRASPQSWHHQQNSTQAVQINEESSKTGYSPGTIKKKEVANTGKEDVKSSNEEPSEVEARERYDCCSCVFQQRLSGKHRCIMHLCLSPTANFTLIQQQPDAIFGTHAPLISRRESIAAQESHVPDVEFLRQSLRMKAFHSDRERRACTFSKVWILHT